MQKYSGGDVRFNGVSFADMLLVL